MKKCYLFCLALTVIYQLVLAQIKTKRITIKNILHAKTWFLFLFAFALSKEGICQSERPSMPPSPQSQEFIKYGDYPVSYFTGVPDISIPLHQVDFYGYKLPVTLKYHPSGITAGSHVDPSGLGWTLFCGGEISRTVHGVPDESDDFKQGIQITSDDGLYYKKLKELSQGYPGSIPGDVGYDEFNVTLPDGTFFKFYISNENGAYTIHTSPAPLPVKISFDYPADRGAGATINSFTIIDEQGVKYDFSDAEYYNNANGWRFKTSWKLSQITLPQSNKTIKFQYRASNDVIVPKKNYTRVIRDSIGQISCEGCLYSGERSVDGLHCIYGIPKGTMTSWNVYDYSQDNSSFSFSGLVPASILFGDYSIGFNYDQIRLTGFYCDKINNIELNDVNKKVLFHMSNVDGIGAITKLDSLIIQDKQQSQSLTYKFDYTTRTINAGISGTSPAYDHWGYLLPIWNNINDRNEINPCPSTGRTLATYNLPNFETSVAWPVNPTDECLFDVSVGGDGITRYSTKIGNANREPYAVPELTLNRIDYPTGGYTVFEYESNKYRSTELYTAGQIYAAGGYRIKAINNYTNGILSERKTYKYGANECGYGFAPVEPSAKTYQKTYIDWEEWDSPSGLPPESRYRERNFSSDNFTNLLGSLPPVMYDEVTEYNGDADVNTGKTIYKYNVMVRQSDQIAGYGGDYLQTNSVSGDYYVQSDEQWKYGQLVGKEVYKNENNVYTLRQKLEQQWNYGLAAWLDDKTGFYMYDRAIYSGKSDPFDGGTFNPCFKPNVFLSNPHFIQTGKATLSEAITTDYSDQLDSVTGRESYTYDTYGHLADQTTVNSNGTIYKSVYKYPYDRNSDGFLNESLTADNIEALDTLVARNIVAPAIQESHYFGQNAVTTKRTDYLLFAGKPFPQSIKLKADAYAIEENVAYTQYDNYGNPLQYTAKDGIITSLLWGYKGQYPVAKVAGAGYATASGKVDQTVLDNPSSDYALREELNKLRSIPNALVTTYTYKPPIGMISETDPNGRNTYYEYDNFNRLTIVRDKDKNIIKRICYNYAGQPENCFEVLYTSTQSKTFIKNDCSTGGTGSSVTYTVTDTSTISQDDADAKALHDVNTKGQTYANNNGYCTYYNDTQQGTYQKNNCSTDGTGSFVTYTVAANTYSSTISKDNANAKAQDDVNANGQAYANNNGHCAYNNDEQSGVFQKNNCSTGGTGSYVTYTVVAGAYYSSISKDDANAQALSDVNAIGQIYANNNGYCTFYNDARQGTYQKNNCSTGGTGSFVTYTVSANTYSSTISKDDANAKAQNDVNTNGQAYANNNGYCTFYNDAQSGTYRKNNCSTGGTGSLVTYTVAANAYSSTISKDDANAKAQNDVNANGQAYANNNGYCTYYNDARQGTYQKNNCSTGGSGSSVTYTVSANTYSSTISKDDANAKAQNDVNANGQSYSNNNGYCTYYNDAQQGTYRKNNCSTGGTGSSVTYIIPANTYSSTLSKADANTKAQNDVNANGQTYANNNGYCTYYNDAQQGTYQKNNCSTGGTGSFVTYTVAPGAYSSTISKDDANAKAVNDVNTNGQTYANNNGYCTYYNDAQQGNYQKNNCSTGGTGSLVNYTVAAGSYSSTISKVDANNLALGNVNANGQTYANNNGYCTYYNDARQGTFQKNNCSTGGTGSSVTYTVAGNVYSSTISKDDANAKAVNDVNTNGQTYANNNGYCTYYNDIQSGIFQKNNCSTGGTGSFATYTVAAGAYSSTISKDDANAKAVNDVNTNGQTYANNNGYCTYYSDAQQGIYQKNNCSTGGIGSSVIYTVDAGAYSSTISKENANSLALGNVNANGQTYANNNGYCTYYNDARQGTFQKNNCSTGGTGSSVIYTVAVNTYTSTISKDDANAKAVNDVNANGQTYANNNGYCTYYNDEQSGIFQKNNCSTGGTGSFATYTVAAGAYSSTISKDDANAKAVYDVNTNGQTYANNNGYCIYYSDAQQGTFQKNNCSTGGTGSSVTYTVDAGACYSTISKDDANSLALGNINAIGQTYANNNGYCIYYNDARQGTFQKNDCSADAVGSSVTYTVTANTYSSTISKDDANAEAQNDVNANGQTYANNNGYCTYYNDEQNGTFTKTDCDPGYAGTSVVYTVPANRYSSTISKDDANAKAQEEVTNDGPDYANAYGTCEMQLATVIAISSAPSYCYQVEIYNLSTHFDLWYEIENGGNTIGSIPPGVYNINFNASGSSCPRGAIRTYTIYYDGNSISTTTTPSSNGYAHFNIPISQSCQIFIR